MPATGVLGKEHSQEGCEAQTPCVDSVHDFSDSLLTHVFESNSTEVSITTVDSGKSAAATIQTSCGDVSSNLDVNNVASHLEPNTELSSSVQVSLSNTKKGFQSTFTAVASASCGDAEDETDMDISASATTAEEKAVAELHDCPVDYATNIPSYEFETKVENIPADSMHSAVDGVQDVPQTETDINVGLEHLAIQNECPESAASNYDLAAAQRECAESVSSDCVYFIQSTDASGQVVSSIINPDDLSLHADSVIYKQWVNSYGEIETTVVHPGNSATTQHQTQDGTEDAQQVLQQGQQIIYAHDLSGQLIPLDPAKSATVAPAGKQFVYMQDTAGRIIRTVMDASQNMVPGQQVYYTQSDDGQIITSFKDSSTAAAADASEEQQQLLQADKQVYQQQVDNEAIVGHQRGFNEAVPEHRQVKDISDLQRVEDIRDHQQVNDVDIAHHQQQVYDAGTNDHQQSDVATTNHPQQVSDVDTSQQQSSDVNIIQHPAESKTHGIDRSASFSIDTSLSGLSMLAELSHLTSGQGVVAPGITAEQTLVPVTDSSNSIDMDEFRPVARVTEQAPSCGEGLESVGSDIAEPKVTEPDSDSLDHGPLSQGDGVGPDESLLARIISRLSQTSPNICRDNLFLQWQNLDAMCWMDVILIMLVHSPSLRPLSELEPSHELASTLLGTLLKANRQAQILLQNLLKKHNGAVISDGHPATPPPDPKTSKLVCKENMDEIGKGINVLYAMREKIWKALQPRLRCERGKHNSPVLVLPLLVRENPTVKQMFTMRYRYVFKCNKCSYTQDDSHSKILSSIPTVPLDFSMSSPSFVRSCFACQAPNQRMVMKFEQLQDFVQLHFVKGLPHSRFDELSFDFNDDHYEVTAFVHYKNNPDHFIAWVRNAPGTMWMECDDLKSVITRYTQTPPNIPPAQVHMVMWERRLTPQHTLVMRDTEDTRLLASLVLAVQQPNAQHTTDSDTKSTQSSGTASSSTTPLSSTSLLSGPMNQNLAAPAHRGRGLGKGVGSSSVRAVASTAIRQINPVAAQLSAVGNLPTTVPAERIRIPLSALTSSGLSLRGGPLGATKYVLVGNSSQGDILPRAPSSRVLVVRTPGGATGMSATQLLQLLQQSGVVGRVGARLAAAVSSSGTSTAAPTAASYLVQDGAVMPTASSNGVPENCVFPEQVSVNEHIDSPMETSDISQNILNEHVPSAAGLQTISTLPFPTLGHIVNSDTNVQCPEPDTSHGSITPATPVTEEVPGLQPILGGQAVNTCEGQQPKYLRITNPAGEGTLCQLAMKDGKMVLLPADRSAQTGSTDSSLLKPLNTAPLITSAGSQQEASASELILAQIHRHLLQSSSQEASSRARLVSTLGTQGSQIPVVAGPCTPSYQPAAEIANSNPADRLTDSDSVSCTPSGDTSSMHGVHTQPQTSNIVIQEDKGRGSSDPPVVCTSLDTSADSVGTEMGHVSSPAVSQLKNVSARMTASSHQHQVQESVGYVYPESSTTHILRTGTSGTHGSLGQSGNTFAALSVGATVDGQRSVTSTVSSVDPESISNTHYDNNQATALTPKQRLSKELVTTKYIPLGRGRTQRGERGRGRRGRGRAMIGTSEAEPVVSSASIIRMSTLSTLQQIGARIIRDECEAVDGVPVVSIPDFSPEMDTHTISHARWRGRRGRGRAMIGTSEAEPVVSSASIIRMSTLSTLQQIGARIIRDECEAVDGVPVVSIPGFSPEMDTHTISHASSDDTTSHDTCTGGVPQHVLDGLNVCSADSSALSSQVNAQQIPSVTTNHSFFNFSTQGTQASPHTTRQSSSTLSQAGSLLTGETTTLQSASSLLPTFSETTSLGLSSSQAEIDAFTQVQQPAVETPSSGSQALAMDVDTDFHFGDSGLSLDDTVANIDPATEVSAVSGLDNVRENVSTQPEAEQSGAIMSMEDNQESASVKCRMPTELFQPQETLPEKSVKLDETSNRVSVSLSPEMFQENEKSSLDDTQASSPKSNSSATFGSTLGEPEMEDTGVEPESLEHTDTITNESVDVVRDIQTAFSKGSKARKGAGTRRQRKHKSVRQPELQSTAASSKDGLTSSDKIPGHLPESNLLELSSAGQESLPHLSSADSVEQSVPSGGDGFAIEAGDQVVDGSLQDDNPVNVEEGYHITVGYLRTGGRPGGRSKTGARKRGGRKHSENIKSQHSTPSSTVTSICEAVNMPLQELADNETLTEMQPAEPERVVDDSHHDGPLPLTEDSHQDAPLPLTEESHQDAPLPLTEESHQDGLLPLTEDSHHRPFPLTEDCHQDGLLPLTGDCHQDRLLPLTGDRHQDGLLPLTGDSHQDRPLPLTEDSHSDGPLPLTEDSHHRPFPLTEDSHQDGLLPLTGDRHQDGLLPLTGDSHQDRPLPLTEDSHSDGPLPLTEDSHHRPFPLTEDSHQDGLLPLTGDSHQDGLLPLTEDSHSDGPLPLTGDSHQDGPLALTEDSHSDCPLALTEDSHSDGPLPLTEDSHSDGPLPLTGDSHQDGLLPLTGDSHQDGPLALTEDSHSDGPLALNSHSDGPLPLTEDSHHRPFPLTEDSHQDGLLPLTGDSHSDGPFPLTEDSHHDGLLPLTGDSHQDGLLPLTGDSHQDGLLPLTGDSHQDGLLLLTGDSHQDAPLPLTEDSHQDGLLPVTEDSHQNGLLPLTEENHQDTPLPLTEESHSDGPLPLTEESHQDGLLPLTEDSHSDGLLPLTEDSHQDGLLPLTEDSHQDAPLPLTEDSHSDGPLPLTEDSHSDGPLPLTENSHSDGPLPLTEDSHSDGPLPLTEDSHQDGLLPLTEDSHSDGPLPLTEDSHQDGLLPLTEDSHQDGLLPLTGDSHQDGLLPLTEDSHSDGLLPLTEDSHQDGLLPLTEDSHHDGPLPLTEDSHSDGPLPLTEDSHSDGPLPLTENSHSDGPLPLTEDSHSDGPLPLTEDSHQDGLLPLTEDSHSDGPLPLTEDSHQDGLLPLTEDSHQDRLLPLTGDSHQDGLLPLTEDGHSDGPLPLTEDGHQDGLLPLTEDSHHDGPLPLTEDSHQDAPLSLTEDSHQDAPLPLTEDSHQDAPLPLTEDSHQDLLLPLTEDSHQDAPLPLTEDSHQDGPLPLTEESHQDGPLPLTEESHQDGPLPLTEDSHQDAPLPLTEDSHQDAPLPLTEESHQDGPLPLTEESHQDGPLPLTEDSHSDGPIPSSVIPRKVNGSRGRTSTGSNMQGRRGKLGKPVTAESMKVNNKGSHNSSPATEHPVKSPGCVLNDTLTHLSGTEYTSVPCSEPSQIVTSESLVMGSAVESDTAIEEHLHEDMDHIHRVEDCQVESESSISMKTDRSKVEGESNMSMKTDNSQVEGESIISMKTDNSRVEGESIISMKTDNSRVEGESIISMKTDNSQVEGESNISMKTDNSQVEGESNMSVKTDNSQVEGESIISMKTHNSQVEGESNISMKTDNSQVEGESNISMKTDNSQVEGESNISVKTDNSQVEGESNISMKTDNSQVEGESNMSVKTDNSQVEGESNLSVKTDNSQVEGESNLSVKTDNSQVEDESIISMKTDNSQVEGESNLSVKTDNSQVEGESNLSVKTDNSQVEGESNLSVKTDNSQVEGESNLSVKTDNSQVEGESNMSLKTDNSQVEGESMRVNNSKDVGEMNVSEQESRQLQDQSTALVESVCHFPLETLFIESDAAITSGTPSEEFTLITSPDRKPVYDPSDECGTVAADSFSTDHLLKADFGIAEHSTAFSKSITETFEAVIKDQVEVSSANVEKSRSRPKGRARRQDKNKRSTDTVEAASIGLLTSGAGAVKQAAAGEFLPQQSNSAGPSQHETFATSSEDVLPDSLSEAGLVTKLEDLRNDCLEIQENPEDMVAVSSTSEKTAKPSRTRERTSKHRGKRKIDKSSANEHSETSSTFPTVSPHLNAFAKPTLHSNENLSNTPSKKGIISVHRKRVVSPLASKDIQKKAKKEQKVKKVETSSTVVCNKRKPADWGGKSSLGNGTDPRASFSYKVLRGRCAVSCPRHASLDQKQKPSVSPLCSRSSVHSLPEKSQASWVSSPAVVKRWKPKTLQTPEIGSTQEVIPLSSNRQFYPQCAHGSVDKDSVRKDAITGVVMRRRPARADWSCAADSVKTSDNLTLEKLQTVPVKYCKRLISSLCISSGDFNAGARLSGGSLKKPAESEEEKAASAEKDVAELEKVCNSVESVKNCMNALSDSEKTGDSVGDSENVCGNDVVDSKATCGNDVVDSEASCGNDVVDSEVICGNDVVDSEATCGNDVVDSKATCGNDVVDSKVTCDNDVVDSETCGNDMVDLEATCGADLGKICNDNVIESEAPCKSSVVMTDDGLYVETQSAQTVYASDVIVNNNPKKNNSNKARSKHMKQKTLSTEAPCESSVVMMDDGGKCVETDPDQTVCSPDVNIFPKKKNSRQARSKNKKQRTLSPESESPCESNAVMKDDGGMCVQTHPDQTVCSLDVVNSDPKKNNSRQRQARSKNKKQRTLSADSKSPCKSSVVTTDGGGDMCAETQSPQTLCAPDVVVNNNPKKNSNKARSKHKKQRTLSPESESPCESSAVTMNDGVMCVQTHPDRTVCSPDDVNNDPKKKNSRQARSKNKKQRTLSSESESPSKSSAVTTDDGVMCAQTKPDQTVCSLDVVNDDPKKKNSRQARSKNKKQRTLSSQSESPCKSSVVAMDDGCDTCSKTRSPQTFCAPDAVVNNTPRKKNSNKSRSKHKKSSLSAESTPPAKRTKTSPAAGSQSCFRKSDDSSPHPGVELAEAVIELAAAVTPTTCLSPTRRSARTPIPSKKILDALEYLKMPSVGSPRL